MPDARGISSATSLLSDGEVTASANNAPSPLNLCRACGFDFRSTRLFDAHRVGVHAYLWSPDRQDGRRCLDHEEMTAKGWQRDGNDRWLDLEHVERARQAFRRPSEPRTVRESGPASPKSEESAA